MLLNKTLEARNYYSTDISSNRLNEHFKRNICCKNISKLLLSFLVNIEIENLPIQRLEAK